MGDNQDLEQWAKSVDLDSATVAVLKEEGFTNLELLRHLSPDRVTENLQKTKRLPLAQSLALKSAIEILGNESSAGEEAETSECHGSRQDHIGEYLSKQTTAQALDEEGETFRLLLVGKTGAGKSTTGNTILGEDVFDSEASFDSVTDLCQLKRSQCNGVNIEILDSPGLFDTRKGHEAVATAIAKSVAGMNPGPHAILYIIKIGRYTEEEEGVYNRLLELFDKHLASYTIVIFTGGDSIKSGRNMEDMLANAPESMKRVLRACQNRYVVFNNMMCDKQPQVDLLLQKVRELVAANGGKPYTCPKYFHIGEAMEEEVRKKMANVEKQHLQSKQYVQELEVKAKQAEEAVEREKEEFEKRDQARKKEMEELEAKRTEQLESLKQQLEQQQLSEEKRRQKTEAFLKKLEEDRLQQMREMEEERRVERENLNRKEEEMSKMIEGRMEEERKLREEMALAHEQEMNELKDRIIDGQEPSLVEYVMAPFVHLIEGVCNLIRKLGSEFDDLEKEEGFTNLELLRHLSPNQVTENLQKTKRLPLAQSLALKSAVKRLGNESSAVVAVKSSECHGSRQDHTAEYLSKQTTAATLGEEGETFRFLMVGFDRDPDFIQLKYSQLNGIKVEHLDSPGLFDTSKGHEAVATTIAKSVAGMYPGPHAILYVIKIGCYTEEEEDKYNRLLELFDKHLASYTIVVFTEGKGIERRRKLEDMLANTPESLKRVLRACQNRYVDFSDTVSEVKTELFVLLQKVRELVAANGGKPYTCPKYSHIEEAMEERVRKQMAKFEKQHIESKQYVQELEVKVKQAEEAVAREKNEFQKKEQARQKEMEELEARRTVKMESLQQQLEQQQMSEEKRRQKTEAFLKKLEEDMRQQMRKMEEERKWEQENLNRKNEEMNKMIECRMEEQKKLRKKIAEAHEQEMTALRERIVDGQEPSFVEYLMKPFVHLIEGVCNEKIRF